MGNSSSDTLLIYKMLNAGILYKTTQFFSVTTSHVMYSNLKLHPGNGPKIHKFQIFPSWSNKSLGLFESDLKVVVVQRPRGRLRGLGQRAIQIQC